MDRRGDGFGGRGGRGQNRKPGDWDCPECGNLCFASKTECFKCRCPKPEGGRGRGGRDDARGGGDRGEDRERQAFGPPNDDPNYARGEPSTDELYKNTQSDLQWEFVEGEENYSGPDIEKYQGNTGKKMYFDELHLDKELQANLQTCGYTQMTPAQRLVFDPILDGRDVALTAQTGTGKTVAFLAPTLQGVLEREVQNDPSILILSPTRELAGQIYDDARKLIRNTGLHMTMATGGHSSAAQKDKLRKGVDVVIGTPGRVHAFINDGLLMLEELQFVILDEADHLIQGGYHEMKGIRKGVRKGAVAILCSATFTQEVVAVARDWLNDQYIMARVAPRMQMNPNVQQSVVEIPHGGFFEKVDTLLDVCAAVGPNKKQRIIVFVKTKRDAVDFADNLKKEGYAVQSIHGDRSQQDRDYALSSFKSNQIQVLVATDVAARGLDIPDVAMVIQVGTPQSVDIYIHRAGRTGRMGKPGKAIMLYDRAQDDIVMDQIEQCLKFNNVEIPRFMSDRRSGGGGRGRGGGGGGDRKPGDWDCPSCNAVVFASKSECFKCGEKRPGGGGGGFGGRGGGGDRKAGDWDCPNCNAVVFASKSECFKCGERRPGGGGGGGGGRRDDDNRGYRGGGRGGSRGGGGRR